MFEDGQDWEVRKSLGVGLFGGRGEDGHYAEQVLEGVGLEVGPVGWVREGYIGCRRG